MADNQLLNDNNDVGGGDDIFVYTGGDQQVPRDVERVRIAENVDTIPANTFMYCEHLIEVEGHNKMKKIEQLAFNECRSLRRVSKMECLIEIEGWAFNTCRALRELEFDKLEFIGDYAFVNCESLKSINMPSIRRIGKSSFESCYALNDAVFGERLERIEASAFNCISCGALRSISIPLKDDIFIGHNAFYDFSALRDMEK